MTEFTKAKLDKIKVILKSKMDTQQYEQAVKEIEKILLDE